MVQDEIKEELIKLKNELKNKDLGSFTYSRNKGKAKEKKYIYKECGDYKILILESDEEMGPRIVVEQKESNEKSKPVNILNKEILTLLDEINEKIKNITCVKN